jgi:hypothetical protein
MYEFVALDVAVQLGALSIRPKVHGSMDVCQQIPASAARPNKTSIHSNSDEVFRQHRHLRLRSRVSQ